MLLQISGNLLRYLRWRATAPGRPLKRSLQVGDAEIHYRSYGQGPAILLLHGGLSHRLSWFSQVPWLVTSGRQVILLETRGHGASGLGNSELSYRLLASDAAQILHQLSVQHADVIGWSDGANTALLLAQDWPELVDRIIAISGNTDPSGLTPEARTEDHIQSRGLTYWFKRWLTGAGARFSDLEKRIKHLWQTGPTLPPTALDSIKAPTLVIIGEQDLVSPEHARQMAKRLPNGTLFVVSGGGHATQVTHADQVNSLIGRFLQIPPSPDIFKE